MCGRAASGCRRPAIKNRAEQTESPPQFMKSHVLGRFACAKHALRPMLEFPARNKSLDAELCVQHRISSVLKQPTQTTNVGSFALSLMLCMRAVPCATRDTILVVG